uniref:Uncharacterized protein n=1 Tax=Fagus sylvatica TaxID=28930 RepID=A0A2N9FZU4_FAGSY
MGCGILGCDMKVPGRPCLRGLSRCIYDFVCFPQRGSLPGRSPRRIVINAFNHPPDDIKCGDPLNLFRGPARHGTNGPTRHSLDSCLSYFGSTGTAKTPPYPYRVPRGYGYCRGTAACVPPVYPFSAKKKYFRYGFGTGRVGLGTGQSQNGIVLSQFSSLSLQPDSLSPALCLLEPHSTACKLVSLSSALCLTSSTADKLGSLSSALCLSLPPPLVSSVLSFSLPHQQTQ